MSSGVVLLQRFQQQSNGPFPRCLFNRFGLIGRLMLRQPLQTQIEGQLGQVRRVSHAFGRRAQPYAIPKLMQRHSRMAAEDAA